MAQADLVLHSGHEDGEGAHCQAKRGVEAAHDEALRTQLPRACGGRGTGVWVSIVRYGAGVVAGSRAGKRNRGDSPHRRHETLKSKRIRTDEGAPPHCTAK